MRKNLLITAVVSSVLLLSACGPLTPSPTDSGQPSAPATVAPSVTPTSAEPAPATPAATVVGTCAVGSGLTGIPAIYVAFSDGPSTPLTISYTVFNADGTVPVVTETVTGPVVTRISYPCVTDSSNGMWTFTVTTEGTRIGCASSFGGQIVDSTSEGDGGIGSYTADCTGNPGV